MKRVIDGVTYNTDTSTRLANSDYETDYNHQNRPCEGTLYQTRGGAFFVWETIDLGVNEDGEPWTRERFKALSAKEAEEWIMTGDVEIIHNPFGEPPEAVAEETPSSTLYVRVPPSLKRRVDEAAKDANLSGNSFTLRCLERCLKHPEDYRSLFYIWDISSTFRAFAADGEWSREQFIRALSEIADRTEVLTAELFPDSDRRPDQIFADMEVTHEVEHHEIQQKYGAYKDPRA